MSTVRPSVPVVPASQRVLCPYCGEVSTDPRRCDVCRGHFDPLSRQATQNAMGPWFIRDSSSPFRPGCTIETLRDLIRRGKVNRDTVIRGPGTKQFWNFAGRTPSVANLLGLCHNCRAAAKADDYSCKSCGATFSPDPDRQHMGLAPVHMLPGEASPEMVAAASLDTPGPAPVSGLGGGTVEAVVKPAAGAAAATPHHERRERVAADEERESSLGAWVVGITVVMLVAMGTVVALVATKTISVPWLTGAGAPTGSVKEVAPAQREERGESTGLTPATATPPDTGVETGIEKAPGGVPGPTSTAPPPAAVVLNLDAILRPMLAADPFNEAAMLARIEELRKEQPSLGKELDSWAAAARARGERIRLRGVP